jgi:5-methyltetrahydrofolate--homocysteine methyltransferase
MATVKGDVHDIGKNIVGVVLGCNGYDIIDLGVMVPADKILNAAKEHGAQAIGLSGLITPSLEEMSHFAAEMKRLKFDVPLLIGGATTSRAHTAIKIAPNYDGPVVYVPDASRAVGVVTKLLSIDMREDYLKEVTADYEAARALHAGKKAAAMVSLEKARANAAKLEFTGQCAPVKPNKLGVTVLRQLDLAEIAKFIDWSPFFQTWDLAGRFPKILDDAVVGEAARNVFHDAQTMLGQVIEEGWLTANAVFGLFPVTRENEDITFLKDSQPAFTWYGLRRQHERPDGKANQALADFVAPTGDYAGAFAVTAGIGIETKLAEFEAQHDDYRSIMLKSLADRLAEAAAEWLHREVRTNYWGYAAHETLDNEALVAEKYQGIRPAPGYPACPDHTAKGGLFQLLDAPGNAGMALTENFAMTPAASVAGFYLAHPDSIYFAVSKIGRDQLQDWAARSGYPVAEAEKWLAPLL